MKKILRRMPIKAARFDKCHAKHAVLIQRVLEHFPVTRLENVKWEQGMRKKHCAGQRHDRDLRRQFHLSFKRSRKRSTLKPPWSRTSCCLPAPNRPLPWMGLRRGERPTSNFRKRWLAADMPAAKVCVI